MAGLQRTIEECFRTAKSECGPGHHQGCKYHARYRHITPAMAVNVCLAAVRAQQLEKGGLAGAWA
ncbi:hypothetical protein [Streptomyces marokkonensis]|uniref:hypothetical protein n=1 Tax=Streptomyces marokkonensis TaxID=324855 RepID=UPI0031F1787F